MTSFVRLGLCAALAVALASPAALAHVGSSPQTNNRYITVVPEPGAVRLVYTLIFGDSPGAAARRRMDGDDDGRLSPGERRAFADSMADAIAAGLDIELDGEPVDLAWTRVDIGIGTAEVRAGALSVDLAAIVCTGGGDYALGLTDAFRVPPVGEGGLAVEPSGVEVLRSAMGGGDGRRRRFKWTGQGAIADEGYALAIRAPAGAEEPEECADASAAAAVEGEGAPGVTAGGEEERGGPGREAFLAVVLVVGAALGFAIAALRRRR